MSQIRLTIIGQPVAKARARTVVNNGKTHTYTPTKTAVAEDAIRYEWMKQGKPRLEGPLAFHVWAYIQRPKSVPIKKRSYPTVAPDDDNYRKLASDALNKLAFHDDCQIVDGHQYKRYADEGDPRTEIIIEELGPDAAK